MYTYMIILSAVGSALRPLRYASRPFCSAKPSVDGRKMQVFLTFLIFSILCK